MILNLRLDIPGIENHPLLSTQENSVHVASMIRDRFNDRIRARYEDKIAVLIRDRFDEWVKDIQHDGDKSVMATAIVDCFNDWVTAIDGGYEVGKETLEAKWE